MPDRQRHARSDTTQFQRLVENIPGIVAYMDVVQPDNPGESLPVYISPQIEDLLGYPRDAWLTDEELWLQVLHPDDAERMIAADTEARRTLSSLFAEYRMIARDGRVIWVSEKAAVVEDTSTGIVYWQGVMVDITDRRNAEDALATSEQQFRSIFDAASIGVMTLDREGRILEANHTLEELAGYPPAGLNGRLLSDLLERTDVRTQEQFAALVDGRAERCDLEHRLVRSDGSPMWSRTVMKAIHDGEGTAEQVVAMVEDISDRKRLEEDLVHRTLHDGLTGLPNRQRFVDLVGEAQARRGEDGPGIAVLFIDMDGFKEVNDSLGHHAGDELLVAIARRLAGTVRSGDTVARYGGDEFLILAGTVASTTDATQLAWRLANALRTPFSIAGEMVGVTASLGIAFDAAASETPEDLVRKADAAMYRAKQRGRNRVAVFGEDDGAALSA
jgi:diguanylate cyclase (GGDEF)-like protein/PAS domain S-box-containing protein